MLGFTPYRQQTGAREYAGISTPLAYPLVPRAGKVKVPVVIPMLPPAVGQVVNIAGNRMQTVCRKKAAAVSAGTHDSRT